MTDQQTTTPFRPAMELGFDDCDPVATCHCGARLKGDSVNDALMAWGKHLVEAHRGERELPDSGPFPHGFACVQGRCPACKHAALFLGDGGYVTCGNLQCTDPSAVSDMLEQP